MPIASALLAALAVAPVSLLPFPVNQEFGAVGTTSTAQFKAVPAGFAFDEAIVSWNVFPAVGAAVTVEARPASSDENAKWYLLGEWQLDDRTQRKSRDAQKDDVATVSTDTLELKKSAEALDVRLTLKRTAAGPTPVLRLVTVSFSKPSALRPSPKSPSPAWGKTVDVPQRAQANYPRGGVLCSPTSMSMMLWHYSNVLNRPELNKDVPEVEANVWDAVYDGAGNWPFNAAYAGSFSGMRSYVARFRDLTDLEKWIAAGLPVIASVSLDMLKGIEKPRPTGHLVVVVGFAENGDVICNDPAWRDAVRRTYPRANFEKGWMASSRTVYVVHPDSATVPKPDAPIWMAP